jgi:hypothetical protein
MFIVGLASLVVGYAIAYYGIDAMSHYDSTTKTTKGLPFSATLGIPGGDASQTAMVFAKWGTSTPAPSATGAAAASPSSGTGTPGLVTV